MVGDHQLKPDIGGGIARRWYDVDQVDLIVDVPVSAVGLAVQNIANEKKKLFITHSTGTADFHGKFCSPYAMQWVFDTRALAVGTAQAVVKRGGDSWFFITDDYAFGHSLERDASAVDHQEWRQGAGLGAAAAGDAGPVVVRAAGAGLQGQDHRHRRRSAQQHERDQDRLPSSACFKGGQQMAALLALITDIHSLGLPAAQGLLLTTSFYWDMDDKTREWSKRYFAKMNRMPTMWQAGVYSSVMHYLNAIKEAGTDEPLKVAAKMREKPIEDFFSRNGKLREDNLMVHDLWLVQVKKPEESKYPWDYYTDPREDLRRRSVRPARSGVFDGEEVTASSHPGWSARRTRPQVRNCAPGNIEIRVRIAPNDGRLGTLTSSFRHPDLRKYFITPGWISSGFGAAATVFAAVVSQACASFLQNAASTPCSVRASR